MTSSLCSRCHSLLHREDQGSLVFCWNCGAPQVQLSEDLLEQIEKQIAGQQTDATTLPIPASPAADAIDWSGAIQLAGLAGLIAAAFVLFSFALPPVALFTLFWLVGAPIVILGIYAARFRRSRITTGFGARLGLLSGIAIALGIFTLNTVGLLLQRSVFHSSAPTDLRLADIFAQMRQTLAAQPGPAAAPMVAMLGIPEFRAGFLLGGAALFLLFYLTFATLTGAFAGFLRSRATK